MARNPLQLGLDNSDNALANAPLSILDPNAAPSIPPGQAVATTYDAVGQWLAQQRAKSAQMGLWDDRTGLPTQAGLLDAIRQSGTAVALGTGGGEGRPGFTAYHGSPHKFAPTPRNPLGEFNPAKIGTGEGNQAFGYGHYGAEAEGVAKTYRNLGDDRPVVEAQEEYHRTYRDLGNAVNADKPTYDAALKAHEEASKALEAARAATRGHMYEVRVNADPEHFLDWNKPLSEQHPDVQAGAAKAWDTGGWGQPLPDDLRAVTGEEFHQRLAQKLMAETHRGNMPPPSYSAPAETAAALQNADLPGIRYLADRGSGGPSGTTHNVVVFNPEIMEIIRRYGIGALMAGGGAAAVASQQPAQANPLLQGAR